MSEEHPAPPSRVRRAAWIGGPVAAALLLAFGDLDPGRPQVTACAAVALLMATWWISEAVPLAVTALLPVVLFPTLGVLSGKATASLYFNHVIFLFIGGFIVALAMQRWRLHERIALRILLVAGAHPKAILAGFMGATAFLSMWISNTAATMMMVAIALAVLLELDSSLSRSAARGLSLSVLLGVAYSASIGGIATLVGTPPNVSFARIFAITFPDAPEITFSGWFMLGLPVSLVMLVITWVYLAWRFCPSDDEAKIPVDVFHEHVERLGPMSFAEKVVLADFVGLAVLWLTRADVAIGGHVFPGWSRLLGYPEFMTDGTVAIAMAGLLFLVPSRSSDGGRVMDWPTAVRLPWGIVLLFGGGFALASGFAESGLSAWFGQRLQGVGALPTVVVVLALCLALTFLTELTSNTATAEMLLPVIAALAVAIEVNPLLLMVPATLACSCAFMLPVATPPNAIVFGTERLRMADMARAGLVLNLIGVVVITASVFLLGSVLGVDTPGLPDWARSFGGTP